MFWQFWIVFVALSTSVIKIVQARRWSNVSKCYRCQMARKLVANTEIYFQSVDYGTDFRCALVATECQPDSQSCTLGFVQVNHKPKLLSFSGCTEQRTEDGQLRSCHQQHYSTKDGLKSFRASFCLCPQALCNVATLHDHLLVDHFGLPHPTVAEFEDHAQNSHQSVDYEKNHVLPTTASDSSSSFASSDGRFNVASAVQANNRPPALPFLLTTLVNFFCFLLFRCYVTYRLLTDDRVYDGDLTMDDSMNFAILFNGLSSHLNRPKNGNFLALQSKEQPTMEQHVDENQQQAFRTNSAAEVRMIPLKPYMNVKSLDDQLEKLIFNNNNNNGNEFLKYGLKKMNDLKMTEKKRNHWLSRARSIRVPDERRKNFIEWFRNNFGNGNHNLQLEKECTFRSQRNGRPVYKVDDTLPVGTVLHSVYVQQSDAKVGKITLNGALAAHFSDKFSLKHSADGRLQLITSGYLHLPNYPSHLLQTSLNVHVYCNQRSVNLATVLINATNRQIPDWYNRPYEISIPEDTHINNLIKTPLLCIDWDPSPYYDIKFEISKGNDEAVFELVYVKGQSYLVENLPADIQQMDWTKVKLPRIVFLKLLKPLDYDYGTRSYFLNITAQDRAIGGIQWKSWTTLVVKIEDCDDLPPRFSATRYFGTLNPDIVPGSSIQLSPKVEAVDGDPSLNDTIIFSLITGNEYFKVDENTGTLILHSAIPKLFSKSTFQLILKAAQKNNPAMYATAKVQLHLIQRPGQQILCRINTTVSADAEKDTTILHVQNENILNKLSVETENENDRTAFAVKFDQSAIVLRNPSILHAASKSSLGLKIISSSPDSYFFVDGVGKCSAAVVVVNIRRTTATSNAVIKSDSSVLQAVQQVTTIPSSTAPTEVPLNQYNVSIFVFENSIPTALYQVASNASNATFAIVDGDYIHCRVDAKSGKIDVVKNFDYEESRESFLNISICSNDACSFFTVQLIIVDVNDNVPLFEQQNYSATILEHVPPRTRVVQIVAHDADSKWNGNVSYAMKRAMVDFSVDYETGWILTRSISTKPGIYQMTVIAFDHGSPALESSCNVQVIVKECATKPPVFGSNVYSVDVKEDAPVGFAVIQLKANVTDMKSNERVFYRWHGHVSNAFSLDALTGIVKIAKPLDYEERNYFQFLIEAVREGAEEARISNQVLLKVNILDINDNAPIFMILPERLVILESLPLQSHLLNITAEDKDSSANGNNVINYKLEGENCEMFRIHPKSGELIVNEHLSSGLYELYIIATDGGEKPLSSTKNLHIFVEKELSHYPIFSDSTYTVQAEFCPSSNLIPIRRFHASLNSGNAYYTILSPITPGLQLDSDTGILFSTNEFCGNFTEQPKHVVIRAINPINESYFSDTMVVLHMVKVPTENTTCNFQTAHFYVNVKENIPAGFRFDFDLQIPKAYCNRQNVSYWMEDNALLGIDSDGSVITKVSLDAEALPQNVSNPSLIKIFASDNFNDKIAQSTLVFKIEDVNEYEPRFERVFYSAEIEENCPAGTFLLQVTAFDPDVLDSTLKYAVVNSSEYSDMINIDSEGKIFKSNIGNFDRELFPSIQFTIIVYDQANKTDTCVVQFVILDVNDNYPKFSRSVYFWKVVEESEGIGQSFTAIDCVDPDDGDNGTVQFLLLPHEYSKHFSLEKEADGKMTIVLVKAFDREMKSQIPVVIQAQDGGNPPLTSAARLEIEILDVNDNPPKLLTTEVVFHLPCNVPPLLPFKMFFAHDPDWTSDLAFNLFGEDSDLFHIDPSLGLLSFASTNTSFYKETYSLSLEVTDGKFADKAALTVHVQCNSTQPSVLCLGKSFSKDQYSFKVTEAEHDQFVGNLETNPKSVDGTFSLVPISEHFFLHEPTTDLMKNKPMFYEKNQNFFVFLVYGKLGNDPSCNIFTSVAVEIVDVNNHIPQFKKSSYSETLPLRILPGHPLSTDIEAVDLDDGFNAKIRYSLAGNESTCFQIEPELGRLSVTCRLDLLKKYIYEFYIVATDQDGFGKSSMVNMTVTLTDEKFNYPNLRSRIAKVFRPAGLKSNEPDVVMMCASMLRTVESTLQLQENFKSGTYIFLSETILKPKSPQFFFFISSVESSLNDYLVEPRHGLISVFKRDTHFHNAVSVERNNILKITAQSDLYSLTCRLTLTVNIVELQQGVQPFHFENRSITLSVDENGPLDFVIYTMTNSCKSADYPLYAFHSINSTFEDIFHITEKGSLVVKKSFDYETDLRDYFFIVRGSCGDAFDYLLVNLTISDINDNVPTFSQSLYVLEVPEGTYERRVSIGHIAATDKDSGPNAALHYSILEKNVPFEIDDTGTVYIVGSADREVNPSYNLTVQATDSGNPPLSGSTSLHVVLVDVNDNAPLFYNSPSEVTVQGLMEPNQFICQIQATDSDSNMNGELQYDLIPTSDIFAIDNNNGTIRSVKPLALERGKIHHFIVVASDHGQPPLLSYHNLTVKIDDNHNNNTDNNTSMSNTDHSFFTKTQDQSYVVNVEIENEGDFNGEQNLAEESNLTVDTIENIVSYVQKPIDWKSDESLFDQKEYWTSVKENLQPLHFVIDLNCSYEIASLPVFYRFTAGDSGNFHINETDGKIFTTNSLDRENRSMHILTVQCMKQMPRIARDSEQKINNLFGAFDVSFDSTLVIVNVLDENDNPPAFVESDPIYFFFVNPTTMTDKQRVIGKVKAVDPDISSTVTYSVLRRADDDSKLFRADENAGTIFCTNPNRLSLIGDSRPLRFLIQATDSKYTTAKECRVFILTPEKRATLTALRLPEYIKSYKNSLQRKAAEMIELYVHIDEVRPLKTVLAQGSEMDVYAVDIENMQLYSGYALFRRMESVMSDLQKQLDHLRIIGIETDLVSSRKEHPVKNAVALGTTEIILAAVCLVIVIAVCTGMAFLIRWFRRVQDEEISAIGKQDDLSKQCVKKMGFSIRRELLPKRTIKLLGMK
ncbi:Protocadherin Fat 4 [Trichinella patagoniensis]|uniref:Protocadherin Fat 4 n=1 Tax=Trichinella patagoniensis TaxID=990121 RepID=A0A0V0ZVV3_9BILA|nr:Protocadherin Fat 4 [Trichinella patagoniensis]